MDNRGCRLALHRIEIKFNHCGSHNEEIHARRAGLEATSESMHPSVLDEEEVMPSPPLDDLAFSEPLLDVHADNFDSLFKILSFSFQGVQRNLVFPSKFFPSRTAYRLHVTIHGTQILKRQIEIFIPVSSDNNSYVLHANIKLRIRWDKYKEAGCIAYLEKKFLKGESHNMCNTVNCINPCSKSSSSGLVAQEVKKITKDDHENDTYKERYVPNEQNVMDLEDFGSNIKSLGVGPRPIVHSFETKCQTSGLGASSLDKPDQGGSLLISSLQAIDVDIDDIDKHIIQLVPSSQNSQLFAWVVVDGTMHKIPINVPRVFYLNSKASVSKGFPGRLVNKILPHGHGCYNLIEHTTNFANKYKSENLETLDWYYIIAWLNYGIGIYAWVAIRAVILQCLIFLLTLIIRVTNAQATYDSDAEYIGGPRQQRQPVPVMAGVARLEKRRRWPMICRCLKSREQEVIEDSIV
ncbi:DNA polymerase epsilon catalytic subunit [Tanacetum coccineum]